MRSGPVASELVSRSHDHDYLERHGVRAGGELLWAAANCVGDVLAAIAKVGLTVLTQSNASRWRHAQRQKQRRRLQRRQRWRERGQKKMHDRERQLQRASSEVLDLLGHDTGGVDQAATADADSSGADTDREFLKVFQSYTMLIVFE